MRQTLKIIRLPESPIASNILKCYVGDQKIKTPSGIRSWKF